LIFASACSRADYSPDKYCYYEGEVSSLRQSFLILDENDVILETGNEILQKNQPWRDFFYKLLNLNETAALQRFAARERITLLVAHADGSGTEELFSGCLPLFSMKEIQKIKEDSSAISIFAGTDKLSEIKDDIKDFEKLIGKALFDVAKSISEASKLSKTVDFIDSSFVQSLGGNFPIDNSNGLSRVVFYTSNPGLQPGKTWNNRGLARSEGFAMALDAGVNLEGAEVHLVGPKGLTRSGNQQEFLSAFFLGSKSELKSIVSSKTLPKSSPAPIRVNRFVGYVQYPESTKYPVKIRLATDQNGTLTDSWLILERGHTPYIPITGSLTCAELFDCSYTAKGDGFAQLLAVSDTKEPTFNGDLPFAGARTLSFKIDAEGVLSGFVEDIKLDIENLQDNRFYINLQLNDTASF
jgi:hypothetical protein